MNDEAEPQETRDPISATHDGIKGALIAAVTFYLTTQAGLSEEQAAAAAGVAVGALLGLGNAARTALHAGGSKLWKLAERF